MMSSFVNWGLVELSVDVDDGVDAAASVGAVERYRQELGCRNAMAEDTRRDRRSNILQILSLWFSLRNKPYVVIT